MQRESFQFSASFARAADRIGDPVARCAFYDAIQRFALLGEEPDLDALPAIVAVAIELIMPQLAKSQTKARAGSAGGRKSSKSPKKAQEPPKQEPPKPDPAPDPPKPAPPKRQAVKHSTSPDLSALSPGLRAAAEAWLRYKAEKNQSYKPEGLRALVSEIRNNAERYGEQAVIDLINKCMSSNWQGIIFDRLAKSPPPKSRGLPDCSFTGSDFERYMRWEDTT